MVKGSTVRTPCSECHGNGRVRRTPGRFKSRFPRESTMAIGFEYPVKGKLVLEVAPTETFTFSLSVRPHELFERRGNDIYLEVPISFAQATLGDEIEVPTLDGKVKLRIPEGTQTGTSLPSARKGNSPRPGLWSRRRTCSGQGSYPEKPLAETAGGRSSAGRKPRRRRQRNRKRGSLRKSGMPLTD